MKMDIYKIVNTVNNKVYVGYTGCMQIRFPQHKRLARKHPSWPLYQAMNEYGVDKFSMHLIESVDDHVAMERERYWIEYLNTTCPHGYNADQTSLKKVREKQR